MTTKFVWERVCEILAPKQGIVLHTTSEEEARQSQARFRHLRTVIVQNGVELPAHVRRSEPTDQLRITYLGRLHPIKGVENLLDACKLMEGDADPWHLTIAGSGEGNYPDVLNSKVEKLGLRGRVEFAGEVFGDARENLFAESDVLVAPSYVENFGMVIAEALAHEVPVIAGRGTPWQGLHANQCGLWVENDAQSLAAAIRQMRALPLREIGMHGRCWMQREFSWEAVSRNMLAVFQDCLDAPRGRSQVEALS